MAATAVRVGTVQVRVRDIQKSFLGWSWCGTATIQSADFVGMTVAGVVQQVKEMGRWDIVSYYTLNGRVLALDMADQTVLQPGDKLILLDP